MLAGRSLAVLDDLLTGEAEILHRSCFFEADYMLHEPSYSHKVMHICRIGRARTMKLCETAAVGFTV